MALSTNNSAVFKVAAEYEAAKETRLVKPDDADQIKRKGRAAFYNALMGRYGLPGTAVGAYNKPVADAHVAGKYDLSDMTVGQVLTLAQELTGGVASTTGAMNNLLSGGGADASTASLIAEYETRIKTLTEEGADPKAINGARKVVAQARLLQAERALYRSIDAARDEDDDGDAFFGIGGFLNAGIGASHPGGLGPFSAPADLMSLPPSAITLMMTAPK